MDRIDLHVEVTPVGYDDLANEAYKSETSETIRQRIIQARNIQAKRFEKIPGMYCNAQMSGSMVREVCVLNQAGNLLLKTAMEKLQLSARAYDRILKVARTIADLANSEDIKIEHLAEAIHFRSLDREGWAG